MIICLPSFEQLDLSETYMVGDKRVMGDAQNRIKYISISSLILLENLIVIFQHEIFYCMMLKRVFKTAIQVLLLICAATLC